MIYLDNAATTACSEEVVEAMLPYFRERFANAASVDHKPGNDARLAVEEARANVAALVGANIEDVIFTSGATEANNLVMTVPNTVFTTPVEHPSILDAFRRRDHMGDALLSIDGRGIVDDAALAIKLVEYPNSLVSIIATNNETGAQQDIQTLSAVVADASALFHVDATQTIGSTRIDLSKTPGLSGISFSAHKINGPKGIGALIAVPTLRRRIMAVNRGGGHERGLRSGTLNVPGIVGMGVAAKCLATTISSRGLHLKSLRAAFTGELNAVLGDQFVETISDARVSPHIVNGRFKNINGRALLRAMRDDVAFSLGSACATNKSEPSHVLLALGLDKRTISETVRFSFSHEQSIETVRDAARLLVNGVKTLLDFSLAG